MTAGSAVSERIENARAQVQTDSLTITLDLNSLQPHVAEALCRVLGLAANPQGASMPPQGPETFQIAARTAFRELSQRTPIDAIEFAAALSALLHECRHVHDMRATRCGAELLLHDLKIYSGVSSLLDDLSAWHRGGSNRHVPFPIAAGLDRLRGAGDDIFARITSAEQACGRVGRWWNAPSRGPMLPGHSIRSLFEALGFAVQIEWLASTFGGDIAHNIVDAMPEGAAAEKYMRPAILLATLMATRGANPDPEAHDLSWLVMHALSISSLDDAFTDGVPTTRHPGTWFQKFAQQYASLSARKEVAPALIAPYAVESVTQQHGIGGMRERNDEANAAIQELQEETLQSFARDGISGLPGRMEPLLIATEVGIDFRDMQQVLAMRPEYHSALGYVGLLVSGELTTVHVRVNTPDGTLGDFRTPSHTPSNQIGGARAASEASQQMRILLRGRNLRGTFFEDAVHRGLKAPPPNGWGLTFRAV